MKYLAIAIIALTCTVGTAQAQREPSGYFGPDGSGYGPPVGPWRSISINPATGRPYDATNYDQRYQAIVTKQQMRNRRKLEGVTR
jgi:hypothetical protein